MASSTSYETQLEKQIENGLKHLESLQAQLSHALSLQEPYHNLLTPHQVSILAIARTISDELEETKKILSPNSLLQVESLLKTASTSQTKQPSSVSLSEHHQVSLEPTLPPSVTSDSGLLTSVSGANTSPQSPSRSKKKTGQA